MSRPCVKKSLKSWGRRGGDFVPPPFVQGGAVQWFPARPLPPVPFPPPQKKEYGEIGGEKRGKRGRGEEGEENYDVLK